MGSKAELSRNGRDLRDRAYTNWPSGKLCDFRTAVEIHNGFEDYFDFRFGWIWQKPSVPPRNSHRPAGDTENILVYKPKGIRVEDVTFNKEDIETEGQPFRRPGGKTQNLNPTLNRGGNLPDEYVNETGRRFPRSVLRYPNKPCMLKAERTPHPTQKPVALLEHILQALTNPGDLVLDPFAGSASTLVACHRLGRRGIGFEISQEYFEIACDRLAHETEGVAQP